jgi:hypothetical protein
MINVLMWIFEFRIHTFLLEHDWIKVLNYDDHLSISFVSLLIINQEFWTHDAKAIATSEASNDATSTEIEPYPIVNKAAVLTKERTVRGPSHNAYNQTAICSTYNSDTYPFTYHVSILDC